MKDSEKLNEKLDSVLDDKSALIATGTSPAKCPHHPSRCECVDCKLISDRRPKYFNANVARQVECRERLKKVLKKRLAEKEDEIYSDEDTEFYDTDEDEDGSGVTASEEGSKATNLVDERTVEELVEFVQGGPDGGIKQKKGGAESEKKSAKTKKKKEAQRRQLKQEKKQSTVEKAMLADQPIENSKKEADVGEQPKEGLSNKRTRADSSNSSDSNKAEEKKASIGDKSSDSTQHESSIETSRGDRSDWAVVTYPKKPCRSAQQQPADAPTSNEKQDAQKSGNRKSKSSKSKSKATVISEATRAASSITSANNTAAPGPILPTLLLKKRKKKTNECDPSVEKVPPAKAIPSSIPRLLDIASKESPIIVYQDPLPPKVISVPGVVSSQASLRPPTVLRDVSNKLTPQVDIPRIGSMFGSIGEEREKKLAMKSGVLPTHSKSLEHSFGYLISEEDNYIPNVCRNHLGYRMAELEQQARQKQSTVEDERGKPCKFGAIGEEREKKLFEQTGQAKKYEFGVDL